MLNPNFILFSYFFIGICSSILLVAVLINFLFQNRGKNKERKSKIATFNMLLFMFFVYVLIVLRKGIILLNDKIRLFLIIIGLFLVISGTIVNIIGRINLGRYWANQIKIYRNHKLIRKGVFNIVRHPLYASLIWLLIGVSLIYQSYIVLILTLLVFLPMMYYRARQEERELSKKFNDYEQYTREVAMFFPNLIRFSRRNAILPGNKFITAIFLLTAYITKNEWFIIPALITNIIPVIFSFGTFTIIKPCQNPVTRYIRRKMTGVVSKWDIHEIRFTLLFGFTTTLIAFFLIRYGNAHLGFNIILFMFFFKALSGLGVCGGSYIYYSIYRFCPICNVQYYIRMKSKLNKEKKKKDTEESEIPLSFKN